ncbi:uncharacterized protein TRUGW13939_04758 [Talaromyces rugulosus]|uniref:endo-1,3(4)-beta-glucanase n=1 Tax=Talaromyces rugulosus TaxID=121627 RepID=A0A7H8QUF5_TALRU|nr:uncharacterized protein TRUGW13939_04758 [Talaromyces rugulosus]QKX57640.1 hypothetical protein TRUGW13939_04758 [Talaromyces rugulosus]
MRSSGFLYGLTALAKAGSAAYTLSDSYPTGLDFFNKFTFYTATDPTNGYVTFVDKSTAQSGGLIAAESDGSTYIGVDKTNVASGSGRKSVRLTSTASYTHGLFILDLAHMPGSVCGTWPAFWTVGSDWPNNGEIDIIEGVNLQTNDAMTLHTSDGCSINNSGFSGSLSTSNCYVNAAGQSSNAGCGINSASSSSYGSGFNSAGGGVYAMEWTGSYIRTFFFPRGSVPSDITSGSPNPSGWGTPAALFEGNCNIDSHFGAQQIVFDITFCGDWAGSVWSSSGCTGKASTCNDFVQNNPTAFDETYWRINSLKVYKSS